MTAPFARIRNQGSFFLRNVKGNSRFGQLLVSSWHWHCYTCPSLASTLSLPLETNIYRAKSPVLTCRFHGNGKKLISSFVDVGEKNNTWSWRGKIAIFAGSVVGFSWLIYNCGSGSNYVHLKDKESQWKDLIYNCGLHNSKVLCADFDTQVSTSIRDMASETDSTKSEGLTVTLYQYETCPFCCKVRAFLDFYGIPYKKVEVNPLFRTEIKFSEYRKVPIAMIGDVQVNDSSLIISVLRSYMLGKGTIEELLTYYPKVEDTQKKKVEIGNRHSIMYKEAMGSKDKQDAVREERKWRRWVDDTFIHTLSPNIYRTLKESFDAFKYFSAVGNFGTFERISAQYAGTISMYLLSKYVLKKRYQLKDDVRQSMYDEAKRWTKAIGKKRKFMGGNQPNLADLAVYGVLSGIEGLEAFEDLMENTNIKPWYDRVREAAKSHHGASEYKKFVEEMEHQ